MSIYKPSLESTPLLSLPAASSRSGPRRGWLNTILIAVASIFVIGTVGRFLLPHFCKHETSGHKSPVTIIGDSETHQVQNGRFSFHSANVNQFSINAIGPFSMNVTFVTEPTDTQAGTLARPGDIVYYVNSSCVSPCVPVDAAFDETFFRSLTNLTFLFQKESYPDRQRAPANDTKVGVYIFVPATTLVQPRYTLAITGKDVVIQLFVPTDYPGVSSLTTDIQNGGIILPNLHASTVELKGHTGIMISKQLTLEKSLSVDLHDGFINLNTVFANATGETQTSHISLHDGLVQYTSVGYDETKVHVHDGKVTLDLTPKSSPAAKTSTVALLTEGLLETKMHGFVGTFDVSLSQGFGPRIGGNGVHFERDSRKGHKVGYVTDGSQENQFNATVDQGMVSVTFLN